jgi:hypothetical protein
MTALTMDKPAASSSDNASRSPTCLQCRHYYITWDAAFPYGCRALHFKSRRLPREDVLESSGQNCLFYHDKNRT